MNCCLKTSFEILLFTASSIIFCQGTQAIDTFPNLTGAYLGQQPPSAKPEPFLPDLFSLNGIYSYLLHSSLVFSPSNDEVYFTVQDSITFNKTIYSMKKVVEKWMKPEIVSFSGQYSDEVGWFSKDNKRLYFFSDRPSTGLIERSEGLWVAEQMNGKWQNIIPITSPADLKWNDGEIYVSADLEGGIGDNDIYKLEYHDGHYGMPINLDIPVNTSSDDYFQCLHDDKRFLIYYHFHPSDSEKRGLYITWEKKNQGWTKPVFLNEYLNLCCAFRASISPCGKFLFILNRKDGIQWMDLDGLVNPFNSYYD